MCVNIKSIFLSVCLYGSILTEPLKTSCTDGNKNDTETFKQVGDSYYLINTKDKMNWFEATLYCHARDSDLVTINTEEEMSSLSLYLILKSNLGKRFWLSASDLAEEGKFMSYSDGRPMEYMLWSDDQPNDWGGDEDCAELWTVDDNFYMNDNLCTAKDFVICEKRSKISKFLEDGIILGCDVRKTTETLDEAMINLDCRE